MQNNLIYLKYELVKGLIGLEYSEKWPINLNKIYKTELENTNLYFQFVTKYNILFWLVPRV